MKNNNKTAGFNKNDSKSLQTQIILRILQFISKTKGLEKQHAF